MEDKLLDEYDFIVAQLFRKIIHIFIDRYALHFEANNVDSDLNHENYVISTKIS